MNSLRAFARPQPERDTGEIFSRQAVHTGPLLLVNAAHPLGDAPATAEPLVPLGDPGVTAAATPAKMMRALLAASGCEGLVRVVDGHRSRAQQAALYADTLVRHGAAFTKSYVAPPGASEHETGLALDLTGGAGEPDPIRPHLPSDGPFAAFRALAADYGFVQRYPAGKEDITGIACEPWHFRYVGYPHSRLMARQGWVLEEYIAALGDCPDTSRAMVWEDRGRCTRVFAAALAGSDQVEVAIPAGVPWQASGDNIDAVVVTVWR